MPPSLGTPAGERGELVARLRELALERRQQRLGLRGLRLLRDQIEPRQSRPSSNWRRTRSSDLFWASMISRVESICARNDASLMAAVTTFDVSARWAPASWYSW